MKPNSFLARALGSEIWAITPDALEQLQHLAAQAGTPHDASLQVMAETVERQPITQDTTGQQIAIVNLHGTVVSRAPAWASYYGIVSPQAFAIQMRELADDPTVAAIVIWAESPGGTVSGTIDAAEAVIYAASKKRVVAVASDMAASAAYWIISQATEVVATPTSLVGSIGVITSHMDISGYYKDLGIVVTFIRSAMKKALGQATEPLSKAAREERQRMVDDLHVQFVQAVATGRKVEVPVAAAWATGEIWVGQGAVTVGLADRVASLGDVLAELTGNGAPPETDDSLDEDDDDDWAKADAKDPTPTLRAARSGDPPDPAPQAKNDDEPPSPGAASTSPPSPSQEEPSMNIAALTAKLTANQPLTAEESAFLAKHLDAQAAAAPGVAGAAAAPVDLAALSPEIRALVERAQADATSARADAASAQTTANTERNNRLDREFSARAVELGQPAAFGATLRASSEAFGDTEAGRAQYAALEQAVNASGAQQALTRETGSSRDNRQGGSVQAEYASRVDAAMKADAGFTRATAGQKVMRDDPQFAARYRGR